MGVYCKRKRKGEGERLSRRRDNVEEEAREEERVGQRRRREDMDEEKIREGNKRGGESE